VLPIVRQMQRAGATTFRAAAAAALNERGVRTARGGEWHDGTVRDLVARARQSAYSGRVSVPVVVKEVRIRLRCAPGQHKAQRWRN
jgi:hypothetical protein